MKIYSISHPNSKVGGRIQLPSSKSISNRLLILQAIYPKINISGLSNAEDTRVLQQVLGDSTSSFNIGHAGTAIRFLCAYLSTIKGVFELSGSERMLQRPIKILVEVLKTLGAEIEYLNQNGYPPLKIKGGTLQGGEVEIEGHTSSQYISALLLVAPSLEKGLKLKLKGKIVSRPYIQLTLEILKAVGLKAEWSEREIIIPGAQKISEAVHVAVERDWSAASFWYETVALSKSGRILLEGLSLDSIQGDVEVCSYFEGLGVQSIQSDEGVEIIKTNRRAFQESYNFMDTPDLAQAFIVAGAGNMLSFKVNGLSTLIIKETNRLLALQNELMKVGIKSHITDDHLEIISTQVKPANTPFVTYQDHRMAMALAPLALIFPVEVSDPDVVVKSYPNYWSDLEKAGFVIEKH